MAIAVIHVPIQVVPQSNKKNPTIEVTLGFPLLLGIYYPTVMSTLERDKF